MDKARPRFPLNGGESKPTLGMQVNTPQLAPRRDTMLLHKRTQRSPSKETRPMALAPSNGQPGQFRQLRGDLYIHGLAGELRHVPKALGSHLIERLRYRNKVVRGVRWVLGVTLVGLLALAVWWLG